MKVLVCLILTTTMCLNQRFSAYKTNSDALASPNWSQAKDWKLYYVKSKRAYAYSLDTLKEFKSIKLDQDSMRTFLKDVTDIPPEKAPAWMGYYVSSCTLSNGRSLKIEISQYGRFFYDESEKKYYQLSEDEQDNWLSYLSSKWVELEGASN